MRPYFSVGEEVILCSNNFPKYNGEYIVRDIVYKNEKKLCKITGDIYEYGDDLGYILDDNLIGSYGHEAVFKQTALRKKHKPADQSFSELIKSTRELKV